MSDYKIPINSSKRHQGILTPSSSFYPHYYHKKKGTMFVPCLSSSMQHGPAQRNSKQLFSMPSSSSSSLSPVMHLSIVVGIVLVSYSVLVAGTPSRSSPAQPDLFHLSIQSTIDRARSLAQNVSLLDRKAARGGALDFLVDLLDDSLDLLGNVVKKRSRGGDTDVHTWLSAALTNHVTCMETLKSSPFPALIAEAEELRRLTSDSLALFVSAKSQSVGIGGRRLLSDSGGFPSWVGAADRRLLEAPAGEMAADAVVAKDGTGTHRTVAEALAAVSGTADGKGRTVIYVKAGVYREGNLKIPTKQKNVMLVGEGKGITVISGDKRNGGGGSGTYDTATLGVTGDGFIARDISFVNSAGPGGGQAVALRVGSDQSVIFRCSVEGYQDTLYAYSKRQFYRNTDIYGTVDFIFGDAAAVFQSCNIYVRAGRQNFVTAQGRTDPNQNTGFSIHNCRVTAAAPGARAFLGRPWKEFSRTVVMQSFLGDVVDPAGWASWVGGPKTVYYGEYMNSGPGSATSGRIKWPGYHAALSTAEAGQFTVASFISGNLWLPPTGVAYDSGLL